VSDEQQVQDTEAITFARREACADVIAALEARVAHLEAVFASPGWAALAAWFAGRPEQKVRELEAERDRLIGDVKELIAMNERMTGEGAELEAALAAAEAERDAYKERLDTLVPPLPPEWEGSALKAGIKAAVDQAKEYRGRAEAAEARCVTLAAALDRYGAHQPGCALLRRGIGGGCTCGLRAALRAALGDAPPAEGRAG
jgi:hypothetical protein